MKLKILNLDYKNYPPASQKILRQVGLVTNRIFTTGQLAKEISRYDILIVDVINPVDKNIISKAKNLKIIATAATGTDHIDVDFAQKQGIKIISLKGQREFLKTVPATAELTFGLILALTRHIPAAFASVKKYEWRRPDFKGTDLMGKTLGIIGFGRLGEMMARYGQAFDMKVIAADPYVKGTEFKKAGIKKVSLAELLKTSDVVSIHVDLNEKTRNLVSAKELSLMKKTAILINTARGQLVNESALLSALKNKKIAGAALDVLVGENEIGSRKRNSLLAYANKNKNLIITPHIGGMTQDSADKARIFITKKVKEAVA